MANPTLNEKRFEKIEKEDEAGWAAPVALAHAEAAGGPPPTRVAHMTANGAFAFECWHGQLDHQNLALVRASTSRVTRVSTFVRRSTVPVVVLETPRRPHLNRLGAGWRRKTGGAVATRVRILTGSGRCVF